MFSKWSDGRPRPSTRISTAPLSPRLPLKHLDAVNVALVPVDVTGHGNVMSFVTLEGIGIVHRQNLLVIVSNDNGVGATCEALLCPSLCTRSGSLNDPLLS